MKKILMPVLAILLLASCSKGIDSSNTSSSDAGVATEAGVVKKGDTISVNYVGRLEDGTVFDTSIKEEAEKAGKYTASRTYEPLSFTVGAGQMIPGFDAGVVDMKVGEKKTITIAPKDAYGEKVQTQEVPKQYFQDVITQKVPLDSFKDTIEREFPIKLLGEKAATAKVGDVVDIQGTSAKIIKMSGENVTLQIDNAANPFHGKKLKVGLKATFEGNDITIKKLDDKEVTLEINNKQNPFYKKKLAVGLSTKLPNGSTITIKAINNDKVTVEMPNSHELAGKTLIFEVEVTAIK